MTADDRPLIGAVLLGGASSRFGSDKALASVGDRPLGAVVVSALRDAGLDPVVGVGGTAGPALGLVTLADAHPGQGPLGALLTVLRWARVGSVVVATCDLPQLRATDLAPIVGTVRRLGEEAGSTAVVATVAGQPDVSLGAWPTEHLPAIAERFRRGARAFQVALDETDWLGVELRPEALRDADTPEQLRTMLED